MCHWNHWKEFLWNLKKKLARQRLEPGPTAWQPCCRNPTAVIHFWIKRVGNFALKRKIRPYWMNNFSCILQMRRKIKIYFSSKFTVFWDKALEDETCNGRILFTCLSLLSFQVHWKVSCFRSCIYSPSSISIPSSFKLLKFFLLCNCLSMFFCGI